MNNFWKAEPLTDDEDNLLAVLNIAHFEAAFRKNASTVAFQIAADSSGDYIKAVSCALATLGGKHAPVELIQNFLANPPDPLPDKVPGFGNSFVSGEEDPIFLPVRAAVNVIRPDIVERVDSLTKSLHERGKFVYPNPGMWTAATAITLGVPPYLSPQLFLLPRLEAWASIFHQMKK